ncbi:OTU domain-containing protein 5-like [Trichosurus vulpecula]|uniref:OTU domain-containing protein 5-like n=1 Tax=Trichosurus vulpecula TaxID=9337 RepID=UPI00186B08C5|nr:OTU domain-containing protein 5-like [Trichosurus vulpecula]
MTILPKKAPPPSADGESSPDGESVGCNVKQVGPDREGHGAGPSAGVRPRSSPPPALPRWAPGGGGRGGVSVGSLSQASPPPGPPGGAGANVITGDGLVLGSVGGPAGCCSGPGLSKRRRQQTNTCSNSSPLGSSERDEGGAGYNSEDEYDAAASHIEAVDPATMEQQEHWFQKALRDNKGFVIKQMKEDGACLFRAFADQVYGDQDMHEVVRKHCMDYLMKNADYFSNYVTEDFTTYINRKRKNNCHGNHIEMQAMAEMYNRPVEVYQYSTEPINTFRSIQQNEDEPIRVSYHRNIHYNSVVNPNKATIGVGLGLPSFRPGFAEQSLMKNAIKTSEESWIEQQMLEDKKRVTDWEATNEAIEEQVARESYLEWLQDQEKQTQQIKGQTQAQKASATCTLATAATSSNLDEWSSRSPRQRNPEQPELVHKPPSSSHALTFTKPPSPSIPGPSSQSAGNDCATSPYVSLYPALECQALIQQMSPTAFGLNDWDDDGILASVLAISQQEYLDSMKKSIVHRDPPSDKS